jgi:L-ascorbate metabolism protein UlaG (beta-lactamase superfamily)
MMNLKGTRITWLGHATVLVQTAKGTNILIDPFITGNPKYPKDFVLPEKIHYILATHGHGDHISDVVPVAAKHHSTVVAIYELAAYFQEKGVAHTVGMNLAERCNWTRWRPPWSRPSTPRRRRMNTASMMWASRQDLS